MRTSAKRRILMFLENLPFPQDQRVRREACALVAGGYEVTVICPRGADQPFLDTVNGVRVYRYPAPSSANGLFGYLWEYAYSMIAAFVLSIVVFFREGFDVIHAHNPPDTYVFIAMVYKLIGKRFIFDHHDLSPEMYQARFSDGGKKSVFQALVLLEKLTCRCADHVIVTNESYKRMAIERGGVPESRITIVRNGVELSRLQEPVEPDRALREMGKSIIGYVGVMGFQDGVDYLLRAFHSLRYDLDRTDFYCVLVGSGDAWLWAKALARELKLDDYVWFTGPIFGERLRQYLSAADICVDASPTNGYSDRSTMVKLMEYMSLGKAIVAFDLPEHRFTAQGAAAYVRPNDVQAFARELARLMDDPGRRATLSVHGLRRIRTDLAWDYSVPRLLSVYQAVLPLPRSTHSPGLHETGTLSAPIAGRSISAENQGDLKVL